MAQTGFTPIVTYNTATATTVPSAANLAQGELAVNVTDKKLYTKDSGGNVVLLASNGGDVTGPASSTNLAIPTFSGTGGKTLLDNSGATISAGVITATGFAGALNGSLGATTPSTAVVTSINKMAITAPATSSTLAVADGKTLTANKTLTLDGTDGTTQTFPTTSATIARTDAAQTFTGNQSFSGDILPANTKGINYTAVPAPPGTLVSQNLNYYAEGEFTTTISPSTSGTVTLNASNNKLAYVRSGKIVLVTGYIAVDSVSSPLGSFTLNLPYTSGSSNPYQSVGFLMVNDVVSTNISNFVAFINSSSASMTVFLGNGTTVQATSAQQLKAGTELRISASYICA